MQLTFLGAAGTVTGSRYLVRTTTRQLLVDCGLFQGLKQLRLRNREPFAVPPAEIDAIILTHAHLDHSGFLPVLVRDGFRGPVYCTPATQALCGILLPDSGHLQEEEAAFANRHGYSKHRPALPLYTRADAERALETLRPVAFEQEHTPFDGVDFRYDHAGHIPGAGMVTLAADGQRIVFSGDLGRFDDPLLPAPAPLPAAEHLLVESTYGDRRHPNTDPLEELALVISRTLRRGGSVVIPAFAVGRTQLLLYYLHRLQSEQRIPSAPIFLDSPMAAGATRIFARGADGMRLDDDERAAVAGVAEVTASVEASKAIDRMSYPRIIVSASGMATGGRVLHHLKALAPDRRNTILLAGHQAAGTRGAQLRDGAAEIKIHGQYVPVNAEVAMLDGLSAHADYEEILAWLGAAPQAPRTTWVTHGEQTAADALRLRIEERLGWRCRVPEHRETVALSGGDG
jgi:metallo-beta-lactamase family protein